MPRLAATATALAALAALAACGDNLAAPADAAPDGPDLAAELAALPGVHDATEEPTLTPGYRYVVLHFTQPVDHADPAAGTFLEEVSLLHKDAAAPLVVETSGYWDFYLDRPVELTELLGANQISIEHRYFGPSRPQPADWSKLTIEQMADDEHAIVTALRAIYPGPAVATGASKGGMTAVYYRRFFPDDVAGTVPYVAPISYGAPDERYPPFLDAVGPAACRPRVRDVATEMLAHRRAAMEAHAMTEAQTDAFTYTRVQLGPAIESAIDSLEWTFWQYYGVSSCGDVPATTASDDALWSFLQTISPVSANDDQQLAQFEPYVYQADFQLGYPDPGAAYLAPYLMYTDADYAGSLPQTPAPAYDGGAAMHDIDDFVEHAGSRLLFLYGQWDPWSGGAFTLGAATDSLELVEAQGTHLSDLVDLAAGDRAAAFGKLAAWTGVQPDPSSLRTAPPRPIAPRVPPAILRGVRARRTAP